ncbi:hypothetical protein HYV80_05865 [Candidatus Woesearchaeota archaeon]|nr:hypothetical protein [Candidatus Woesearchaeota archaeon]
MRNQILSLFLLALVGVLAISCTKGVREAEGIPDESAAQMPVINETANETIVNGAITEETPAEIGPSEAPETAPEGGSIY